MNQTLNAILSTVVDPRFNSTYLFILHIIASNYIQKNQTLHTKNNFSFT